MVEHKGKVGALLLGCALCSPVLLADAQSPAADSEPALVNRFLFQGPPPSVAAGDSPQTEASSKSTDTPAISFGVLSPEQINQLHQQVQQRQAKLREQLADPKQRDRLRAERIVHLRQWKPDLAVLLRLDARTEDKLLALLADQQLAAELQPPADFMAAPASGGSNGKPHNPLRDEAVRYTQRMNEVGKVLDAARLDDYADYQRKMGFRARVVAFDSVLPAVNKLTFEQRNALTDLLYDQNYEQIYTSNPLRGFDRELLLPGSNMTDAERRRREQVRDIVLNERSARLAEAANRELVERATAILSPEQAKALSAWKQQIVDRWLTSTQTQRKALGIALDEKLDDWADDMTPRSPLVSRSVDLTIDLTVNDSHVLKELTSVRGDRVSFDAPEDLVVEVRPYLVDQQLCAQIMLYEKAAGSRRLIGQLSGGVQLIEAGKPPTYGGSAGTLIQGRKGYAIEWSVRGTYL